MLPPLSIAEQEQIDAVTADALTRLKSKVLGTLSCREAEQLLDGNFRLNDEICSAVQQAWDCALALDCRLCEADRPWEERNKQLQAFASERAELLRAKASLEGEILCAKLEVQSACAGQCNMKGSKLAAVLDANLKLRERCARFEQEAAALVNSARRALRDLGQHPEGAASDSLSVVRRWRVEFDAVRHENEAMLKALRHPNAASAVPPSALEERIDHTWRFLLELVGVFEKLTGLMSGGDQKEAEAERISSGSEKLRQALEAELPALLECKFLIQEATAKGNALDVESAIVRLDAAQKRQAEAWHFLTSNKLDLADVCPTKFAEEMLPHPAAFGSAGPSPETAEGHFPPVVRVLTYNIFLRAPAPQFTHNTDNDRKDERLRRFVEHLKRYDLVCLQEAYGCYSHRREWLIDVAKHLGFSTSYKSPTSVRPRFLMDGGLLVLSRLPMDRTASLTFDPGTHLDFFSAKGAIYCRQQCGPSGPYMHVCTTHLQSTYSEESYVQSQGIRHQQIGQLITFLQAHAVDEEVDGVARRRWPMLLCGTLNFNGRRSAMDGSHSTEYCAIAGLLQEGLGEVKDLVFDTLGSHPVTYADTRLTEAGEVPAERVLTTPKVYENPAFKRQCLDYMFFFPEQRLPTAAGADAQVAAPPGPDSGALPSRASDSNPSGGAPEADASRQQAEPECMVPATCHVEKFLVDRAQDVGAPVTQLSDHYGIGASLAVVAVPWHPPDRSPERRSPASTSEFHVPGAEAPGFAPGAAAGEAIQQLAGDLGAQGGADRDELGRCEEAEAPAGYASESADDSGAEDSGAELDAIGVAGHAVCEKPVAGETAMEDAMDLMRSWEGLDQLLQGDDSPATVM